MQNVRDAIHLLERNIAFLGFFQASVEVSSPFTQATPASSEGGVGGVEHSRVR